MEVKSLCTQWKRYIWEVGTLLCDVYEAREWATGLQLWRYCTGGKVWQPMWLCWQGDLVQTQPNDVTPFPQSAHSGTPLHVALNWHSHCASLRSTHLHVNYTTPLQLFCLIHFWQSFHLLHCYTVQLPLCSIYSQSVTHSPKNLFSFSSALSKPFTVNYT